MRGLVQRVTSASVTVDDEVVGSIGDGLCVLVGVTHEDTETQATKLADKLWNLRVFNDDAGQLNLSAADLQHSILVVSQFTLYGDANNGRRPSFINAARPEVAEPLIETLVERLRKSGAKVETGRFRTEMTVAIVNDGPITVMIEV